CKQQGKIPARSPHLIALFFYNSRNLRGYSHCCDACRPVSTPAEQGGAGRRANRTGCRPLLMLADRCRFHVCADRTAFTANAPRLWPVFVPSLARVSADLAAGSPRAF